MTGLVSSPDTRQKLEILSADAQYDLACACGTGKDDRRRRGSGDGWIYPVTLAGGGTSVLFKTLISNVCANDCRYCPLRADQDVRRCALTGEETVRAFLDYYTRGRVFGLFLTSGVPGTPDAAMEQLIRVARILRTRHGFRGYIHLKIIPGASAAAVEEAVSLSTAVSLNIETPGARHLARLSRRKDFLHDIVEPIKLVSRLTARGSRYERVKQTTQFVVGAAEETDAEIVRYMEGLYDRLRLQRVYFSAYQKGPGDSALAGEGARTGRDALAREHRLYQVDFLMRRYGFAAAEIGFDPSGNLPLELDPKEEWARRHPEFFPLDINRAPARDLLRVPGLGEVTVRRIVERRKGSRIRALDEVARPTAWIRKAGGYLRA